MGRITKLTKSEGGAVHTAYPITIPQAVVDPASKANLAMMLEELDNQVYVWEIDTAGGVMSVAERDKMLAAKAVVIKSGNVYRHAAFVSDSMIIAFYMVLAGTGADPRNGMAIDEAIITLSTVESDTTMLNYTVTVNGAESQGILIADSRSHASGVSVGQLVSFEGVIYKMTAGGLSAIDVLPYVNEIRRGKWYNTGTDLIADNAAWHMTNAFFVAGNVEVKISGTAVTAASVVRVMAFGKDGKYLRMNGVYQWAAESESLSVTLSPKEDECFYRIDMQRPASDGSDLTVSLVYSTATRVATLETVLPSKADKIPVKEYTTFAGVGIAPNVYHKAGTVTTVAFSLNEGETGVLNEYMLEFTASTDGCTFSCATEVKWQNGTAPIIEAGKTYQVHIVNNLGVWTVFE